MCLSILGALFIKNPPAGFRPPNWTPTASKDGSLHQEFTPIQMLKTPQFYAVTISFMLACMAGLMVIGFAKPIALAKGIAPSEAAIGVMIIAIFNSFGRLFWGWSSDRIGRKKTILLLLFLTAVTILLVKFANGYLIFALIAVIAFSYGGFLGVFPALTADFWGAKNLGTNYGIHHRFNQCGHRCHHYLFDKAPEAKLRGLAFPFLLLKRTHDLWSWVLLYNLML
jgi:OFA family oxalate/formate antiporter-like MFS transporter